MYMRLTIDTDSADDAQATDNTPFDLYAYSDERDQTEFVRIGPSIKLAGDDIPAMLRELADRWEAGEVVYVDGRAVPATGAQWRDTPEAQETGK